MNANYRRFSSSTGQGHPCGVTQRGTPNHQLTMGLRRPFSGLCTPLYDAKHPLINSPCWGLPTKQWLEGGGTRQHKRLDLLFDNLPACYAKRQQA